MMLHAAEISDGVSRTLGFFFISVSALRGAQKVHLLLGRAATVEIAPFVDNSEFTTVTFIFSPVSFHFTSLLKKQNKTYNF